MDNHYITKDIYLASFLQINGFTITDTSSTNGTVFFHFKPSKKLDELVLKYFSRSTSVEPTRFLDEIKQLRHLVQDTIRQGR
jgi:hypothetical protein